VVVAVVPPRALPDFRALEKEHGAREGTVGTRVMEITARDHESYVVLVQSGKNGVGASGRPVKPMLYWPRVSTLHVSSPDRGSRRWRGAR
jgi:hypothetical protein